MKKRLIAVILLAALIVNIFSLGVMAVEDNASDAAAPQATAETVTPTDDGEAANDTSQPYTTTSLSADFEQVSANDQLELYVNKSIGAIAVKDVATGYIWYSSVPSDTYSRNGMTKMQLDQLNSLFVLGYTILNDNNSQTFTYPINNLDPEITTEKIDNGVRINYYVDDINLRISVDVQLEGDSLVTSIPKDKIIEGEGTEAKMNKIIGDIQSFIDECNAAIDELDEIGLSSNKRGIKNSRASLDSLQDMVDSIDSLVGVASVQSQATDILRYSLQVYLFGGGTSNDDGCFRRAYTSKAAGDKASHLKQLSSTLETKLKKCIQSFSLLTTIQMAGVVNIELLPNMGAAADNEDGYVFYPDGSGALTYNTPNHGETSETYETSVYSEQSVDMAWENNRDSTGLKRTMLPVYGSKKNNQAFLAIIESGDANASICLLPSGNVVNLNRINSKFKYRNSVQITSSSEYSTGLASIFEKTAQDITPVVRYQFLNGQNYTPDYSGMANAYRDYLIENNQIKKSSLLDGNMPLALDFVAGAWKSMLFYQSYVSISSFEEMGSVVDELNAAGINNILMHVQNWEKQEAPSTLKVPGAAGGADGLKNLNEKLNNTGGHLFMSLDIIDADTFSNSINESRLALDSDLRIFEFQSFWYKLFSPAYIQGNIDNTLKSLDKLGNPGVAVRRMGELIYYDYNDAYKTTREDCVNIWNEIYGKLNETAPTAAYSGNGYLLNVADWLMDIPMSSTGYTFSNESVPFYQMVVHGSIPYSAKPFNHFYDTAREKLQTIEYGCIPLYKLTYNDSSSLRKLFNDFTTPYENIKDDIIETYNEFNGKLSSLTREYMTNHQKLTNDVVIVTYSNGTKIYINYSKAEYTTPDGVVIPAEDYVIA